MLWEPALKYPALANTAPLQARQRRRLYIENWFHLHLRRLYYQYLPPLLDTHCRYV